MVLREKLSVFLRRTMFWMLIPAIALVAESLSLLYVAAGDQSDIALLFVAIFGYVLLGSMVLNAWLALRHPDSLYRRELPTALAAVQASLYVVEAVWLAACFDLNYVNRTLGGEWMLVAAVPLMALSIAAFVLIARRRRTPTPRLEAVPLTPSIVIGAIAVIALAAITSAAYLVLRTLDTDGYWTFALMLPGLPWSHTLYLLGAVTINFTEARSILTSLLLVPATANVVLAIAALVSGSLRTRAANWFFRLRGA